MTTPLARIAWEVRSRQSEGLWLVGIVVKFPDEGRIVRFVRAEAESESATVIILPVIRVEHDIDGSNGLEPNSGNTPGRRRRRRLSR